MSIDYFAASSPRAFPQPPAPPMWLYQPDPRTRSRRVAGNTLAVVAGGIFFLTVVLPSLMALVIGVMIVFGGGLTF
jgi:hypothetical protein